ncbi:MAG: PepSY domain-containing protein [Rhizobiaceae bacterium]|nr:PepSY domain-containing protein [Rhizobiaceae bacterium]
MMARPLIRTLLVGIMLSAATLAQADRGRGGHDDDDSERARQGALSGEYMPLADLMKVVKAAYPGQIVETELEERDGAVYYEIYVLQADGRVIEVKVDARTGRILKAEEDD